MILTTACSRVSLAEGGRGYRSPAACSLCLLRLSEGKYDDGEPGDAENENRGHQAGRERVAQVIFGGGDDDASGRTGRRPIGPHVACG